jgi:hypothetical protein
MNKWEKITDKLKVLVETKGNEKYKFTLTLQEIGIYGSGRALILRGKILGEPEVITEFWTQDDKHGTYKKESCNSRLWTDDSAEKEANRIINDLVEKLY